MQCREVLEQRWSCTAFGVGKLKRVQIDRTLRSQKWSSRSWLVIDRGSFERALSGSSILLVTNPDSSRTEERNSEAV